MSHNELIEALRAIEGLRDVGLNPPNFHFRSRPFLHFHDTAEGMYADVRFGTADFEPVWAATPEERESLLRRVRQHVQRAARDRKAGKIRYR